MSPGLSAALSLVALLTAILAIVLATLANRRWAQRPRPRGELDGIRGGSDEGRSDLSGVREVGERPPADLADPTALRHVAVVRYDAFADVGGRLSYSVAILDDTRSGLVLTTLSGKSDVRMYVRTVSAGEADGTLTAEEQQAIDAALGRDA